MHAMSVQRLNKYMEKKDEEIYTQEINEYT